MAGDIEVRVEAGWREFRQAVAVLPASSFDAVTSAGWTAKEMLAHVAFWEETVWPVVDGILRDGQRPANEAWFGGSGLDTTGGWPPPGVHNAREAAWAREHTAEQVLARLDRAHARAMDVIAGLTEDERANPRFVDAVEAETYGHYPEHLAELRSLAAPKEPAGA